MNKKEHRLELEDEQDHLNFEEWDIKNKNSQIDEFDAIELSEELGDMELKNFLYKR